MSAKTESLPRIVVAGVGPVPPQSPQRLFAPGLRVWGIARELAAAGHPVRLATVHFSGVPLEELLVHDPTVHAGRVILGEPSRRPLKGNDLHEALAAEARRFRADAIVGSMDLVNRELARIDMDLPIWCDYFGDPMAERQMLASIHGGDGDLTDQWSTLAPALARADRVSGCSRYQVGALLGEMATLGRLNRHTAGEPLAHRIAPWIEPIPPCEETGPFVRGKLTPADALIAIQTGGFNTWLDIDTLFEGLQIAMKNDRSLHYAATGGAIEGHNEVSFARFRELVDRSEHRERYHFLGWIPLGQVPRVIAEADFGLNVDLPSAEGWLGTRNRIMDWLIGGKPVVSTLGSELAEELAERDLLRGVAQGDPEAIAEAIGRIAADPAAASEQARRAAEYLRREHAPERCLKPLLDWARRPQSASDLHIWREGRDHPPELWRRAVDQAAAMAAAQKTEAELRRLRSRLKSLEGSRLVRWALRARTWLGGEKGPR